MTEMEERVDRRAEWERRLLVWLNGRSRGSLVVTFHKMDCW